LVSRDWKNVLRKKCHEINQESSSGTEKPPPCTAERARCIWRGPGARTRTRKFAISAPKTGFYKTPCVHYSPPAFGCDGNVSKASRIGLRKRRFSGDPVSLEQFRGFGGKGFWKRQYGPNGGSGAKHRHFRVPHGSERSPDSDSPRKALQKSGLGSNSGPQHIDFAGRGGGPLPESFRCHL
jgi:hypothetical protein